ncbi:Curved DNA-binding protein [compost metagenome]
MDAPGSDSGFEMRTLPVSAPDYYQILGVSNDASEDDIKRAFRKLAREHHPDRHQGPAKAQAEARFKEITAANDVLSDPQKRQQYDQMRRYFSGGAGGPYGGAGPSWEGGPRGFESPLGWEDLFGAVFGSASRGGPTAPPGRGAEISAPVEISLDEAYHGTAREVRNPRTGARLRVKIPPGVETGSTVRAGEVTLAITVLPDPRFEREGDDLRMDLPITFLEAIDGGEVPVPTLDGPVKMKIPARTQSGKTFRLKGKGMSRLKGEGRGDLYVKVAIHLPPEIDDQALALWHRLGKLTPYDPRSTRP